MISRHRHCVLLSGLGFLVPVFPLSALPPCGPAGTITTVTAPDGGDYIAVFRDYKIYPAERVNVGGGRDLVAGPEYRSYYPQYLALGPRGRVHVADPTIIYRLEADGSATRLVGVPQYSAQEGDKNTAVAPLLQQTNVLQDTVAALEARIAPGPMTFDREGRLYFVDYVNQVGGGRKEARIARLEADGQVTTYAARVESAPHLSLLFEPGGHLLVAGWGGVQGIDAQGGISRLLEERLVGALRVDAQGRLYYTNGQQIYRRLDDGTLEVVAGYDWGDPDNPDHRGAIYRAGVTGRWEEPRLGGVFVGNGRPATEAPLLRARDFVIDARGVMYIANRGFDRIHRVGTDGVLETIAGDGTLSVLGCSRHTCRDQMGDGGPALDAPIPLPLHILLTPENDLLVPMSPPSAFWVGGVFSFLRRICGVSDLVPTAVAAAEEEVPTPGATPSSLRLYPNPSNASVTVAFDLDRLATVSVRVYDELGQRVRVLAAEAERPAGPYQFVWDGLDQAGRLQASGTYFLVVSVDGEAESHKLTLLH